MMDYATRPGVKANARNLPAHVAIIMDGNGRWAASRQLSRTTGHRKGVEAARDIIFACHEKGIQVLTLFAFGMENWRRPAKEVRNIFRIFFLVLRKEIQRLHEKDIRLRIIGDRRFFNATLLQAVRDAEFLTRHNTGLCLNIAVNYSGRWDILQAVQKLVHEGMSECSQQRQKFICEDLTEERLAQSLSLAGLPDPDLFIRTGGVERISNFILWELAYTELYFTKTHWPDFTAMEFNQALDNFAKRERRFGLTSEQIR